MSSVAAPNPGIASLLQFLAGAESPTISSVTSSAPVQSALKNASSADLIQLSAQALQFQQVEGLFSTSSSTDPELPAPSASTVSGSFSPSQLASYQNQVQLEQLQTLFATSGTSISVLG